MSNLKSEKVSNKMNKKPLTEEEYNKLDRKIRYYYRKNKPELLINIKNLFKPDGRKKKYLTEEERKEVIKERNRKYRENVKKTKFF